MVNLEKAAVAGMRPATATFSRFTCFIWWNISCLGKLWYIQVLERTLEINSYTKDELGKIKITNSRKSVVCVVLASKGYPESYNKEIPIPNLKKIKDDEKTIIFHAGTKTLSSNFFSNGGRVLNFVSTSDNFLKSREEAINLIKKLKC